ncbi:amino acid permease [Sphingobium subterraneum]|uniref:APA family basic amino acid/polyamine antiporter n=1 Tax=Sphingobium subterraneum TaxID=627688 RepID=A0A841IXQ6_9SPHN|nr:amino acid permease [Sphingobium subterraneum]MBB6123729.1 APA family basic amino acid/polyamine antiporter [Sphingobium subterraneum]
MATDPNRLFLRKSLDSVRRDSSETGLRRHLGPIQLVLLGIGCIIGAGVYVMTGTAAANYAGPAVVLSFGIAGLACAFTGLCYAELSSVLPVSGASYTYAYAALGEVFAWALGWMLMLEFGLAGAALAVGFSGYLQSLLADFGITIPAMLAAPTLQSEMGPDGLMFEAGASINLLALISLGVASLILVRGIAHSAAVNTLLVVIKLGVLLGFVAVGSRHIDTANLTPFIPANEGGFRYGVPGIFRAASVLFFAYLGFEAVATAASEARKPQRDVPIGILGALFVSTLVYAAVAFVMTGLVSYRTLNVADPIAIAVEAIGMPVFAMAIKIGALTGLGSVLLVNTYGQSRICLAMASDRLIPGRFAALHARFATPAFGTFVLAGISGLAAALLPITLLADLVSIGTAFVFVVVAISVMWLRTRHPDLPRPFRVPLGGIWVRGIWIGTVPVLAILLCLTMMGPVLADIFSKAIHGEWIPMAILLIYIVIGILIYALYGSRHSRARAEAL